MTFEEFDKFYDELIEETKKMRDTKGREYAHEADRFANFKRNATALGLDPLQVWAVYFMKHIDSIMSFVQSKRTFSDESIRGRFVDAITYLGLAAGMVAETHSKSKITIVVNNLDKQMCAHCGQLFKSNEIIINGKYHEDCYFKHYGPEAPAKL